MGASRYEPTVHGDGMSGTRSRHGLVLLDGVSSCGKQSSRTLGFVSCVESSATLVSKRPVPSYSQDFADWSTEDMTARELLPLREHQASNSIAR